MHVIPPRGSRRLGSSVLAAVVAAIIAGCYPGDIESLSQTDVVATIHDKDADFQTLRTYVVPDTVVNIAAEPGTPSTLPANIEAAILEYVRANMQSLGYVEEDNPTQNPPDVVVACSYTTIDFTVVTSDPWCDWWGWYGYSCGGWGWYPGYDTVNYTAGTLLFNMFDLKNRDPESEHVPMIWAALCSGLLEGASSTARIREVVDRAFDQSPYLELDSGKAR